MGPALGKYMEQQRKELRKMGGEPPDIKRRRLDLDVEIERTRQAQAQQRTLELLLEAHRLDPSISLREALRLLPVVSSASASS